jgi:phosphatidylserine/phosphatidylglycerophosphate/cardiolipin synthase-like enzyme
MRKRKISRGVTVNAIAGTHVVLLGFDLTKRARTGCLGFAIQREDHTEDERVWLKGMKTFESTDPGLGPGGQISSREHPFQSFQWADYSAKPDHEYTYTVVPVYGKPNRLEEKVRVSVRIRTESEFSIPHSVFFNRGAVASQEYARRFQNQTPDKMEKPADREAAYKWLSRGLFEAFQAFALRARNADFELHGAIYEFQWPEVLETIKGVAETGAKVHILYDAIPGNGPKKKNEAAIQSVNIAAMSSPRTVGKIMHNKFFVLSKKGKPIAVWTGSTNLTENGLFGHSNLGHIVEDKTVASAYLAYWKELKENQAAAAERNWMAIHNPNPPDPWSDDHRAVFSPRSGLGVLKWYADIANSAQKGLFMTFAFGMHDFFKQVFEQKDGVMRFALMEKEGNGSGLEQGKKDIRRIRRLPNVVVAIGNNLVLNSFDRWLKEKGKLTATANVRFIHTKFMLVDPLGKKPIVVTGSANFSAPSTNANHENMLLIRNNKRVADIYLGEFMRLHSHYAFREAVKIAQERGNTAWKPNYLAENDKWQEDYFKPGSARFLRREYFAGNG